MSQIYTDISVIKNFTLNISSHAREDRYIQNNLQHFQHKIVKNNN